MSYTCIKLTERVREGVQIINALPFETFLTALEYVRRNMNVTEQHEEPENALEELEKLVGVPRSDFLLLIKTFSYILKRISIFIVRPHKLLLELREHLKLHEDKVDAIFKLWVKTTKPLVANLASDKWGANQINDVATKLNTQISSHCQQRQRNTIAFVQLKTGYGRDVTLEMNHNELMHLYNQLENIQNELDALQLTN